MNVLNKQMDVNRCVITLKAVSTAAAEMVSHSDQMEEHAKVPVLDLLQ